MSVVQLWNSWSNWDAFTTVKIITAGGDEIGTFYHHEDVLNLYADKEVYAFGSVNATDKVVIAIEV